MTRFSLVVRIGAILIFVGVLNTGTAFSQQVTGTILGRVTDSTGAVVPSATIQIQNPDIGLTRTETADSDGRYFSANLPLGAYTVTVTKDGFQTLVRSGIELKVGAEVTINAELVVGNVQQHVEVTGEAPQVETTNATISDVINSDQVRDLPLNGRNVDQLALLAPGIIANHNASVNVTVGYGLHISANGARPQENLFLLDGTVVNDAASGRDSASGEALGVEGILEFRVLTHSFSAEYGRNSGAVVSAVTRSGTNEFHGSAYEFVRNDLFDANNFFNHSSIPQLQRNQFGGAAGGPIKKDRIFFFANYEGLRQRQGNTIVSTVPDACARQGVIGSTNFPTCSGGTQTVTVNPVVVPYLNLYPLPNGPDFGNGTGQYIVSPTSPTTENYTLVRMDFKLSDKDTFYARYVHDPSTNIAFNTTPEFAQLYSGDDNLAILSETHVLSPSSLNEFRFAFNRTDPFTNSFPVNPLPSSLSFVPGQLIGGISTTASTGSTSSSLSSIGTNQGSTVFEAQNLFQYSDTFSHTVGAHSLKFGIDFQRTLLNNLYDVRNRGVYTFSGGLPAFLQGTPSLFQVEQPSSNTERGWRRLLTSAFAEDDFRVRPNLTLNLGLRYEDYSSPVEANGRSADLFSPTSATNTLGPPFRTPKLNLAPRLGIAWDPTGNGKTSIRAGAGIFFSQLDGYTWFATSTNNTDFIQTVRITNPVFPNALTGTIPAQALADQGVQYHSQTPTVVHWNLGIQRQLSPTLTLGVSYIGSAGYHLPIEVEWDQRVPTVEPNGSVIFMSSSPLINPNFTSIQTITTNGNSNYHGLQVELTKVVSKGLQFQVNYTYSRTLSDADEIVSGQTLATPANPANSYNPEGDWGLSAYDEKHNLIANWVYQMPWDKKLNSKLTRAFLGGWAVNGIFTYGSGLPFDVESGFNSSLNGNTSATPDRPNLKPGFSNNPTSGVSAGCRNPNGSVAFNAGTPLHTPTLWFDPCAFSLPVISTSSSGTETAGTYGNVGRNTVIGPNFVNLDFALVKATALTEKMRLEFRAETFNLFNHPTLGLPTNSVFTSTLSYAGNAGSILTTASNNRQLQLGMKLSF